MASLFISYSRHDHTHAQAIQDQLEAAGFRDVFLDADPEQGIPAGQAWERALYAKIRQADAIVFLSSPASIRSQWCFAELTLARATGTPVIPVLIKGSLPSQLADTQAISLDGGVDQAMRRLIHGLQRHGLDPRDAFAFDPMTQAPYPGMVAFDERDAAVFFGRERETKRLLEMLEATYIQNRFMAVVGPSGSGKSSLVRAGLLPRLAKRRDQWVVVPPMVPGQQPVEELARSLTVAFKDAGSPRPYDELEQSLTARPAGLVKLAKDLRDAVGARSARVLVVVDQAEELLTVTGAEARGRFLALMREASADDGPLQVVATLRSEFLSATPEHAQVTSMIDQPLLVGTVERSHLAKVIEGPARRAGLEFAPELVQHMVDETHGGDALPLLAHTLRQLYDRCRDRPGQPITLEDYQATGGIVGALQRHADALVDDLARHGHGALVLPTLTKLVSIDPEGNPTRRRFLRSMLSSPENKIVQQFIKARLLISDTHGDAATVEVAHEALLRQWSPLREVVQADQAALRQRSELERVAQDWDRAGRRESYLLRNDRLAEARSWAEAHPHERAGLPLVWEFLQRSAAYEHNMAAQDQAKARHTSEAIANRVLENAGLDGELRLALAVAAIEEYASTPRAILALTEAMLSAPVLQIRAHSPGKVSGVKFTPDGARIVTGGEDGAARVWDATSGAELLVLRHTIEGAIAIDVTATPDGTRIVTGGEDGTARVWDATSGAELLVLHGHESRGLSVAFAPDGTRVVTGGQDGTARVWDATSGAELLVLHGHKTWDGITSVTFASDGTRIVTCGGLEGTARVWDATNGAELLVVPGHNPQPGAEDVANGSIVFDAALAPDGTRLITVGTYDGVARVWDATSGAELFVLRGHDSFVSSVAFASDGSRIVIGGKEETRVWDVASGSMVLILRSIEPVSSVAFSVDGTQIVTGGEFGFVRTWPQFSVPELITRARASNLRPLNQDDRRRFGLLERPDGPG